MKYLLIIVVFSVAFAAISTSLIFYRAQPVEDNTFEVGGKQIPYRNDLQKYNGYGQ